MSKLIKAFLVVAGLWVLLGALVAVPFHNFLFYVMPELIQVADEVRREEVITKPAAGINTLQVQTISGSIIVIGADTAEITIRAYYRSRGHNATARVHELRTDTAIQGHTLAVSAVFPTRVMANDAIRYEIIVPRTINLNASTVNGRVDAHELIGTVDVTATNGPVEVLGETGPSKLTARTTNGGIAVKVAPRQGQYELRTINGSILVALPEDLGVTLRANAVNGGVTLDYGQWMLQGGQISRRNVNATLGDGALQLDVNTVNGSIRFERLGRR